MLGTRVRDMAQSPVGGIIDTCQIHLTISERAAVLARLRAVMRREHIDAVLIPSADPHLSEYLPGRWKGREWLSGFTGSVGAFIATADFAGVWTDARYWDQAEAELAGSDVALMKIPSGASLLYIDWLAANLQPGQTVAVDARVLGLSTARLLAEALAARGIALRTDLDLLDEVWSERPALPPEPVFEHAAPHASASRADKLAEVRAAMAQAGRQPPLHLHPRRHRLAVQPARRRRQLQPGVPGARADRAAARDAVRRPTPRCRPTWPSACAPTASTWRRTTRPKPRWPNWAPKKCCWSTRAASPPACAPRCRPTSR